MATEFIENIKNRILNQIPELVSKNIKILKKKTSLELGISIILIIVAIALILWKGKIFGGNVEDARYLLSALIQSLAAILTIVVTVTLVAVQMAAQAYTPRIIESFKRNIFFWMIIVLYGSVIAYCGVILSDVSYFVENSVQWVNIALFLSIAAIFYLIPYIRAIIRELEPSTMIRILAENINGESVENFISLEKEKTEDKGDNPLQPIIDIIIGSIMKYNYATSRFGIKLLTDKCIEILPRKANFDNLRNSETIADIPTLNREREKTALAMSKLFCDCFEQLSLPAFDKGDEKTINEIIQSLVKISRKADFDSESWNIVGYIGEIGIKSTEKKYQSNAYTVIAKLEEVGIDSAEKGFAKATECAGTLIHRVAGGILEEELWSMSPGPMTDSLGNVGRAAIERKLINAASMCVIHLEMLGIKAMDYERRGIGRYEVFRSIFELGDIGLEALKNLETKSVFDLSINALYTIGKKAYENNLMIYHKKVIESLIKLEKEILEDRKELKQKITKVLGDLRSLKKDK